jgi:valyl-tRNA synthetase
MNVENLEIGPDGAHLSLADRWVRSRLKVMLSRVEEGFTGYRLDVVANALYEFTWHEFCDWYLEFSKAALQSDSSAPAAKAAARFTLISTLEVLLRALHPVAPFISEEIWQRVRPVVGATPESIMRCAFPLAAAFDADAQAETEMRWVMDFILGIRQIRGEMDIPPGRKLTVLLQNAGAQDLDCLSRNLQYLTRLAGIEPPRILETQAAPISAVALLGSMEILVPMAGLIEPEAELERLSKRLRKAEADLSKVQAKLGKADFARNAPPEIVAKDEQRVAELRIEIAQLSAQIATVRRLKDQ